MNKLPAWYFDELNQVGTDYNNPDNVQAYNRAMSTNPKVEQELVDLLGVASDSTLIDFGCGSGDFAVQAAKNCKTVYAVDVSPTMLALAQQKADEAGVTNMEFHHAGFLTYEHQGDPVNFIVTKTALHHLPDFWKTVALTRMYDMLGDGGMLCVRDVVFSFDPQDYTKGIDDWIRRYTQPEESMFTASEFETHVREEYSTFGWIMEGMLLKAGFEIMRADYFSPDYAQYICKKKT